MSLKNIDVERVDSGKDDSGKEKPALQVPQQQVPPAWEPSYRFSVIGKGVTRQEAREKVTGSAVYTSDVRLPGQLYAGVLRCPFPHARVRSIDSSRVLALPGVHAVIRTDDETGVDWYGEKTPLLDQHLRFAGDEVAAVACETPQQVEDALALFDVQYETLPFDVDMEKVLRDGLEAPLHGDKTLMSDVKAYARGDAEKAFDASDVQLDKVYTTQTAMHNALEPHGTVAHWQGDELVIHASTQGIFAVRSIIAEKLGLPQNRVRVIKQHMGGGFGAKQVPWKQAILAALLSRRCGQPVQLMLDREGENLAAGNRSATRQHVRLIAGADGRLTAIIVDALQTGGAYSTPGEASNVVGMYQHLYACDNVSTEQRQVYINAGPAVAFRAPGYVEAAFALESAMDELAVKLGMDPLQLRRLNYAEMDPVKDQPWSSPDALRQCYERLEKAVNWPVQVDKPASEHRCRGVGVAAHEWMGGTGSPPAYAYVQINPDASVDVITGTQDIGTGSRTVLAQVAAEALGVPMDTVRVRLGDTAAGPYAPTSAGSFTTPTLAPAVQAAGVDARRQVLAVAAERLQTDAASLTLREGLIYRTSEWEAANAPASASAGASGSDNARESERAGPEVLSSLAELAEELAPHMLQGHGSRHANPQGFTVRTFGAQFAEVEVDLLTGEITIIRIVCAPDCGRILNPRLAYSQVIGGVTQGIGYALSEERVMDPTLGIVLNANLEDYLIPTAADIPAFEHAEVDVPDLNANPIGAKGLGELPMIPTAPAIANAIFDATGVRFTSLPVSRRQMIEALARRQSAEGSAV